ncbi:MAG: ATP-binding protein [Clostridia bacterium]|nr:ATP-binding protein [[Bacteroides] pectinophilus]MDD5873614.1 ATP-binding protein [Clostridia bacterium]
MNNPFTLSFGQMPLQYISRIAQTNQIIDNFKAEHPSTPIYMITGVRGSGKTVMMTSIANEIKKNDNWIVIELNPLRDMLQSLAAKLYSIPQLHDLFLKAKLDFSAFGLGVSIENASPVTDIEDVLSHMLEHINRCGKRLLITVDEAVNSDNIKIFASSFQIFVRDNLPIYLLMTGLYENIYELQNDKSLTFLYRAPKITLEPLNYTAIRKNYMDIFNISADDAEKMTILTKGYPFAFQVLGYLYWEYRNDKSIDDILPEYDQYLQEYVYEKIWSELSSHDRDVLTVISSCDSDRVKDIREKLGMNSQQFSVYRDRLKRKGVINTQEYGRISVALPRFAEFVQIQSL